MHAPVPSCYDRRYAPSAERSSGAPSRNSWVMRRTVDRNSAALHGAGGHLLLGGPAVASVVVVRAGQVPGGSWSGHGRVGLR